MNEETRTVVNEARPIVNEAKKNYKINVVEPADFDPCVEITMTTTKNLSMAINELFEVAFEDYHGINLIPTYVQYGGHILIPYLYFKILPESEYKEGKHYAFMPEAINKNTGTNMITKLQNMTSPDRNLNRLISVTDDGKAALGEFIMHGKNGIDWNQAFVTKVVDGSTLVYPKNVDLISVIMKIFGKYDAENAPYEYQIIPIKPVNPNTNMMNGSPQNSVIQMIRARNSAMRRSAESVGMIFNGPNSIPMFVAERKNV